MKKLLSFGLLGLIILLAFPIAAYAQTDSHNPFASVDKEYEERLKTVNGVFEDSVSLQKNLSSEELFKQEYKVLESYEKRYIVKFKEDSSMQEIFDIVSLYNYEILGKSENRLFVLEITDIQGFQQRSKDIIEFIDEDMKKEVNIEPSDSYFSYQWALPAAKIPEAWAISKGTNSVYVAVIDSGIYRNHPDLSNTDIRKGWDYIYNDFCDWDSNGHGTNVTGIIGAETNNARGIAGVNWDVAIIPLRVISPDGSGYVSDIIQAIYDAADLGSDVINLSLGSSEYSLAEYNAVSYAISKGSIVVASAGNDGNEEYKFPASYEGVISVGSIDINLKPSDFSQHNNKVDVTAPGENILTTADWYYTIDYSDYASVYGTSFSAPYVSGVAALMSAVKPSITADEFMDILKVTSTDLGNPGYDNYYGYGLINAEKMLQSIATIQVQSVSLNKNTTTLSIGDSESLIATVLPINATNRNVAWKSDNPLVATVKNGIVTAVSSGSAIITVTTQDGGKTASIVVNVGTVWDLFENINLDKIWTIKFNMELDDTSWKDNVYILDSNNEEFPVNVSKYDDGKGLIVTPLRDYDYSSNYTIVIDNYIISETGAKLKNKVYVPFVTIER